MLKGWLISTSITYTAIILLAIHHNHYTYQLAGHQLAEKNSPTTESSLSMRLTGISDRPPDIRTLSPRRLLRDILHYKAMIVHLVTHTGHIPISFLLHSGVISSMHLWAMYKVYTTDSQSFLIYVTLRLTEDSDPPSSLRSTSTFPSMVTPITSFCLHNSWKTIGADNHLCSTFHTKGIDENATLVQFL